MAGWVFYNNVEERQRRDTRNAFFRHELLPLRRARYGPCRQPTREAVRRCAEAHGTSVAPGVVARRQHAAQLLSRGDSVRVARTVGVDDGRPVAPPSGSQPSRVVPGRSQGEGERPSNLRGTTDTGANPHVDQQARAGSPRLSSANSTQLPQARPAATFLVPARPESHLRRHYGDVATIKRSGARGMRCAVVEV